MNCRHHFPFIQLLNLVISTEISQLYYSLSAPVVAYCFWAHPPTLLPVLSYSLDFFLSRSIIFIIIRAFIRLFIRPDPSPRLAGICQVTCVSSSQLLSASDNLAADHSFIVDLYYTTKLKLSSRPIWRATAFDGLYGLIYIFFIEIAPTASVRLRNSPRGIFDLLKVAFARHKVPSNGVTLDKWGNFRQKS